LSDLDAELAVAANITGVRFYIISGGGTFSGKITLTGTL
jgi:hypothetical protein